DADAAALALPEAALAERRVEHEPGDAPDQAGLLGHRDEGVGADEPPLGMLPADECLHRRHLAGGDAGLGLVVDDELAPLDRGPELADELEPRERMLVVLRAVQ